MTQAIERFPGFALPTSNTTYTPNQFFDVVLRYASRGVVRLVAYMLRKTLGWCDMDGNPQEPEVTVSYRELEKEAGIGHSSIREAIDEALAAHYIVCLRAGNASGVGVTQASALFELHWDEGENYQTDPELFQGFYAGEGNRTYIPNSFFDYMIPRETLAVIKVVGAIIRNTIGYQSRYGHRRQRVRMSFGEIQRRTGIKSQTNINKALQYALQANYIVRLEKGLFDPEGGTLSQASVYGLCWQDGFGLQSDPLPLEGDGPPPPYDNSTGEPLDPIDQVPSHRTLHQEKYRTEKSSGTNIDHSEKSSGDRTEKRSGTNLYRTEKSSGNHSEKSSGDRTEKSSDIKIKQNNTLKNKNNSSNQGGTDTFAAAVLYSDDSRNIASSPNQEDADSYAVLLDIGFDTKTARRLITTFSPEAIRQQISWLPRRKATRNRLGLLRKAIEENWQEPREDVLESESSHLSARSVSSAADPLAARFSACFYAGWAGNPEETLASPSNNDIRAAIPFVQRLLTLYPEQERLGEWGRAFGTFARQAEQQNPRAICSLVYALRTHGDAYFLTWREKRKQQIAQTRTEARKLHRERYEVRYRTYLEARENEIRTDAPESYMLFEQDEDEKRNKYRTGIFANSKIAERILETHNRKEERIERFQAFFQSESLPQVLDFWEWDRQLNPDRLEAGEKA